MIKLLIHGIVDGLHDVDLTVPVEEVGDMFEEFFGNIHLSGQLRKLGKRYTITGFAECMAKLTCGISLEEYKENIRADLKVSFLADSSSYRLLGEFERNNIDVDKENIIHGDDKYIDLSSLVREELAVRLPMKRIAPRLRGKSFEDIYPEYAKNGSSPPDTGAEDFDDRWSPLKKLKMN